MGAGGAGAASPSTGASPMEAPQPQADSQPQPPQLPQPLLQENRPSSSPPRQQLDLQQRDLWQRLLQHLGSQPQAGSQADSQAGLQHRSLWQRVLQHLGTPPQAGSQADLAAQPQADSHAGWQHRCLWQRVLQHDVSQAGLQHGFSQQLLQPQPFSPSRLSRSSKPKLWPHRLTLTMSAPRIMFHFIEPRLLLRWNPGGTLIRLCPSRLLRRESPAQTTI